MLSTNEEKRPKELFVQLRPINNGGVLSNPQLARNKLSPVKFFEALYEVYKTPAINKCRKSPSFPDECSKTFQSFMCFR